MLALREHIHRNPIGIHRAIGNNQHFRGTGDHIYSHSPKNGPFCRRNVGIPGTHNFIDGTDRLCAIGQCSNRLSTANRPQLVDTRQLSSREHPIIHNPIGRRRHHHNTLHASNLSRKRIHQHRRRVRGLSTWHINPYRIEWQHSLTHTITQRVGDRPT